MNAMPIEDMSTTYLEHSMVIHNRFEIPRTEDRKMLTGSDDRDSVSVALINLNTSETVIKEMMT